MSFGRDLYKTKLCKLYQSGNCPRQSCSFAHGEAELRRYAGSALNGRRDFRGGDLRERLQRRHSPHNRGLSPGRDSRGRQVRGQSHSRSPVRGRLSQSASPSSSEPHKRDKKRTRHDEPVVNLSDGSGEPRDQANGSLEKNMKGHLPDPIELLEDDLHDIDVENGILNDRLVHFQCLIEEKTKDIDTFLAKNSELDFKLQKEHEEYKRCHSKLKKFVKLFVRCSRAQEEVKKMQARLLKLVEDSSPCDAPRFLLPAEDSDINITSDGEANRIVHDHHVSGTAIEDDHDMEGLLNQKASTSEGKSRAVRSNKLELTENGKQKELRSWDVNAALPSTGLAAHAEDDIVDNDDDKKPFDDVKSAKKAQSEAFKSLPGKVSSSRSPPSARDLPSITITQYAQYEGDDEDVDVEEMEENLNFNTGRGTVPLFLVT